MPLTLDALCDVFKFLSRFDLDVCQLINKHWKSAVQQWIAHPAAQKRILHELVFGFEQPWEEPSVHLDLAAHWYIDAACCHQLLDDSTFGELRSGMCLLFSDVDAERNMHATAWIQFRQFKDNEKLAFRCPNVLNERSATAAKHLFHHLNGCHVSNLVMEGCPNKQVLEHMFDYGFSISCSEASTHDIGIEALELFEHFFRPVKELSYLNHVDPAHIAPAAFEFMKLGRRHCTERFILYSYENVNRSFFDEILMDLCTIVSTLDEAIPWVEFHRACDPLTDYEWASMEGMRFATGPPIRRAERSSEGREFVEIHYQFRNAISGQIFNMIISGIKDSDEDGDELEYVEFNFP